MYKIILF